MTRCPYRSWLRDRGSLTRRIQQHCDNFRVRGLRQGWSKAWRDEAPLIGLRPGELALLREVYLYGGERPLVFAHSVLSRSGLRRVWRPLGKLGNQPLGTALFADPRVRRMPLQFRKLGPRHELFRRAARVLAEKPRRLWARRSVFCLRGQSLLVTEVFLPDILKLRP